MAEPLSGKAFARLDGSSPVTVRRARQAGHIVCDAHGRYDPKNKRNAAWLKREKQGELREATTAEMRLEAVTARLERLEFDVAVQAAFYVDRSAVAVWLHHVADCLLLALGKFPEAWATPLLWPVEAERERFVQVLRAAMAEHIASMGDVHGLIDRALEEAGTQWRGHRPVPLKGMALDAEELPPETLVQAEKRRAAAVTELERMKVRVRRGDLLAAWPAEGAAGDLVLGWRYSYTESFAVRHSAEILAHMGRSGDEERWRLFKALQYVMRVILIGVEGAGRDAHAGIWHRFLPLLGTIPL